jgi:oligopeptide/dipeptide ABC transporter ATP-binding protein
MNHRNGSLLVATGIKKYFATRPSVLERRLGGARPRVTKAVDGVNLRVGNSETLGLVGESGCGKTTLGRVIAGLYEPTEGVVMFDGHPVRAARNGRAKRNDHRNGTGSANEDAHEQREDRSDSAADKTGGAAARRRNGTTRVRDGIDEHDNDRDQSLVDKTGGATQRHADGPAHGQYNGLAKMQMIFQNPYASLNPRHTVRQIIGVALAAKGVPLQDQEALTVGLLNRVGLRLDHLDQYPSQFSGGQRQRIAIARALATDPSFIVADEPVSALDVSVQAQILNLLEDLQAEYGLAYLLISHDLAVVHHASHRIAVMYLGKMAETGPTEELFENPLHPYTQALLSAIPRIGAAESARTILPGTIATSVDPPPGCRFRLRCPYATAICAEESPEARHAPGSSGHLVWCHRH